MRIGRRLIFLSFLSDKDWARLHLVFAWLILVSWKGKKMGRNQGCFLWYPSF